MLTLESKKSKAVQRIGNETIVNYDLIDEFTFYKSKEIDSNIVYDLYDKGNTEFAIHKITGIGRSIIHKLIKNRI